MHILPTEQLNVNVESMVPILQTLQCVIGCGAT